MTEPNVEVMSNEPTILHEGRYRLYSNPDGGMHIVYKRDGAETEDHFEMPGAIVVLGRQMAEGKLDPMSAMKSIMSLAKRGKI